jgi:hypothetical protein
LVPRQSRADNVLDLGSAFNDPSVIGQFDSNLPSAVKRTTGLQMAWLPWANVPGPVKPRAGKSHKDTEAVIRISVGIDVDTRNPFCGTEKGHLVYYVFIDNTAFNMKGLVDSWDTMTDNFNLCEDSVNNGLKQLAPAHYPQVQNLVNSVFAKLPNEHFPTYQFQPPWTGSVNTKAPPQVVLNRDTVVSRWSDLCMDVRQASTANGAQIQQYDCNHTGAQRFNKIALGGDFFLLQNVNSGKCVAISDGGLENGALLAQYDCNTNDYNHHWKAVDTKSNNLGAKWLINRRSNKCVETPGWSTTSGTLLSQLDCVQGWKHYWYGI